MFSSQPRRRSPPILGYLKLWLPPSNRSIGQHAHFGNAIGGRAIGVAPDALGGKAFRRGTRSYSLAVSRTSLPNSLTGS